MGKMGRARGGQGENPQLFIKIRNYRVQNNQQDIIQYGPSKGQMSGNRGNIKPKGESGSVVYVSNWISLQLGS